MKIPTSACIYNNGNLLEGIPWWISSFNKSFRWVVLKTNHVWLEINLNELMFSLMSKEAKLKHGRSILGASMSLYQKLSVKLGVTAQDPGGVCYRGQFFEKWRTSSEDLRSWESRVWSVQCCPGSKQRWWLRMSLQRWSELLLQVYYVSIFWLRRPTNSQYIKLTLFPARLNERRHKPTEKAATAATSVRVGPFLSNAWAQGGSDLSGCRL